MKIYCFNDIIDDNGYHKIHTRDCPYVSGRNIEIGIYDNSEDAMCAAMKGLPNKKFIKCYKCCRECNKK